MLLPTREMAVALIAFAIAATAQLYRGVQVQPGKQGTGRSMVAEAGTSSSLMRTFGY